MSEGELRELDPFDVMDAEAVRIERHLGALDTDRWSRPTRCAGWSVRDVLAHLLASEDYNRATLDGTVAAFIAQLGEKGATDLDSANAVGIAELAGAPTAELLDRWVTTAGEIRSRLRGRADGELDTMVGPYPCRLQAWHLAAELATHADDIGAPVTAAEATGRLDWRARFARIALAESKADAEISRDGELTVVRQGDVHVAVGDNLLVEGVAARLDESSTLSDAERALLSMY